MPTSEPTANTPTIGLLKPVEESPVIYVEGYRVEDGGVLLHYTIRHHLYITPTGWGKYFPENDEIVFHSAARPEGSELEALIEQCRKAADCNLGSVFGTFNRAAYEANFQQWRLNTQSSRLELLKNLRAGLLHFDSPVVDYDIVTSNESPTYSKLVVNASLYDSHAGVAYPVTAEDLDMIISYVDSILATLDKQERISQEPFDPYQIQSIESKRQRLENARNAIFTANERINTLNVDPAVLNLLLMIARANPEDITATAIEGPEDVFSWVPCIPDGNGNRIALDLGTIHYLGAIYISFTAPAHEGSPNFQWSKGLNFRENFLSFIDHYRILSKLKNAASDSATAAFSKAVIMHNAGLVIPAHTLPGMPITTPDTSAFNLAPAAPV